MTDIAQALSGQGSQVPTVAQSEAGSHGRRSFVRGCGAGIALGAVSAPTGLKGMACLAGLTAMSGCSGTRPAVVAAIVGPKETRLSGAVVASADVNPDLRRRASPVSLRLYELKAAAGFSAADFMSLFQRDQAELGADLLAREEFVIQPGESRKLDRKLHAEAKFLAVFVAFRDVDRARWRAVEALRPGASQVWQIRLDASGVSIAVSK